MIINAYDKAYDENSFFLFLFKYGFSVFKRNCSMVLTSNDTQGRCHICPTLGKPLNTFHSYILVAEVLENKTPDTNNCNLLQFNILEVHL